MYTLFRGSLTGAAFIALIAASGLGGCAGGAGLDGFTTGALISGADAPDKPPSKALVRADKLQQQGYKREALAILDKEKDSTDKRLLTRRGLLALEMGDAAQAERDLLAAQDPAKPDWRVLSALGTAASAQGRQKDAQKQLKKALELAPGNPVVLNNLALSYILDGNPSEGEKLLRQARGLKAKEQSPKVAQNLALAVGLKGDHKEAVKIASSGADAATAAANTAYVKELVR